MSSSAGLSAAKKRRGVSSSYNPNTNTNTNTNNKQNSNNLSQKQIEQIKLLKFNLI